MANEAERTRLARLLAAQEAKIRAAFAQFVSMVKSPRILGYIADLIEQRRVEDAMKVVDTYSVQLGTSIIDVFNLAADTEVDHIVGRMTGRSSPLVAITFDPSDEKPAAVARSTRSTFVRSFTQEQRRAINRALSHALSTGAGPGGAVSWVRDAIGLTEAQVTAIHTYQSLLEQNSKRALERAARDRRHDRTILNAIDDNRPLTSKQIERMVGSYSERLLALRAQTIGRTESLRVTNIARQEAFRQVVEDAGVDRRRVVRVWNSTNDKRTRDSHREMDGQEVGLDDPFMTPDDQPIMFPGDPAAPPEEVINCRCVVTHRIEALP